MATSTLYIHVAVDNDGYVLVHDTSDYEGEENIYDFALVEAVFDDNMELVDSKITDIKMTPKKHSRTEEWEPFHFNEWYSSFLLPHDGEFTFMKMLLPKKEHVTGEFNEYYVDGNSVYYGTNECPGSNAITMTDLYKAAFEENDPGFDEAAIFADIIFSIAYLNQCLLNREKEMLEGFNCQQPGRCNKSNNADQKYNRDILLDAHRVLIWLLAKKNYAEAKDIIKRIMNCGGLCSNYLNTPSGGGCNCGKAL